MTLLTLLTSLVLTGTAPAERPATAADIHYVLSSDLASDQAIRISFDYATDESGELLLHFKDKSWGEENIFACIKDFTVSKKAGITFLPEKDMIRITAKPNQKLTISYSIRQDFEPPLYNYHRYRPIITASYFHSLAMRVFIEPQDLFAKNDRREAVVKITAQLPDSYEFQTSFGQSRTQTLTLNQEQFNSSLIVAGDFRRYETKMGDTKLSFLSRGTWQVIDEVKLFDQLQGIIRAQTAFWNEPLDSLFTVTIIPTDEEWTETSKSISIGGSGLTDSFISFASNNAGTPQSMMQWLYSHELMHRWIGGIIQNANEEKQYWFSEGFTDYYAYKLLVYAGDWSQADFVNHINTHILAEFEKNPVRDVPNDSITWDTFWSNRDYQKLPYHRGLLYALLVDQQIKHISSGKLGLDNLMGDLLRDCQGNPGLRLDNALWLKHLGNYLDDQAAEAFARYILNGAPIDFSTATLPDYVVTDGRFALRTSSSTAPTSGSPATE